MQAQDLAHKARTHIQRQKDRHTNTPVYIAPPPPLPHFPISLSFKITLTHSQSSLPPPLPLAPTNPLTIAWSRTPLTVASRSAPRLSIGTAALGLGQVGSALLRAHALSTSAPSSPAAAGFVLVVTDPSTDVLGIRQMGLVVMIPYIHFYGMCVCTKSARSNAVFFGGGGGGNFISN